MPNDDDPFFGQPLHDKEISNLRKMMNDWRDSAPVLVPFANLIKSAKTLAGVTVVLAAIGGAIAYLIERGVF